MVPLLTLVAGVFLFLIGMLLAFTWRYRCPGCSQRSLRLNYIGYIAGERTSFYDCGSCGQRLKYVGTRRDEPTDQEWRRHCQSLS
jgi:hypothetical protein